MKKDVLRSTPPSRCSRPPGAHKLDVKTGPERLIQFRKETINRGEKEARGEEKNGEERCRKPKLRRGEAPGEMARTIRLYKPAAAGQDA